MASTFVPSLTDDQEVLLWSWNAKKNKIMVQALELPDSDYADKLPDHERAELSNLFERSVKTLQQLHSGNFLSASGDINYMGRFFGRDTATVGRSLIESLRLIPDHALAPEIHQMITMGLESLVYFQGSRDTTGLASSEKAGKYHHEAFPKQKDPNLANTFSNPEDNAFEYGVSYVSADSTPLTIVTGTEYASLLREQGRDPGLIRDLFERKLDNYRDAPKLSLAESLVQGGDFLMRGISSSDIGLVEFERKPGQEQGWPIQVLEDSVTGMVHLNGELANTAGPIASIDVQALTYDALLGLAEMFEADPQLAKESSVEQSRIELWRRQAEQLRQNFFKFYWIPGENRFAQAIDRNPQTGEPRWVATPSAKELRALNSRLFDDLPDSQKEVFVGSLYRQAMSDSFLTSVGFTTRDRHLRGIVPFTDYHGESVVWPVISNTIAAGLERQGFYASAEQANIRNLNGLILKGGFVEFIIVDPITGMPYLRHEPLNGSPIGGRRHLIISTNHPENPQAWSASAEAEASARLMSSGAAIKSKSQPPGLRRLEQEVLPSVPYQELITDPEVIEATRASSNIAVIDAATASRIDQHYHDSDQERFRRNHRIPKS